MNKKSTSNRALVHIFVSGLQSSILISLSVMVTQLLKLYFVDKLGKSEFGVRSGEGRLELSTRIRKQNVVLVFLGFKTILLAFGELNGRNRILVNLYFL